MEEQLQEPIDLIFSPEETVIQGEGNGSEVEVTAENGPEPLIDGVLDLGSLATEFLILGINPYPRKPDAEFQAPPTRGETGHPFAMLAKLKKRDGQQ
jgi:hypothetical protein